MFKKRFVEVTSILLIILFVYAATSKLADVEKFHAQVGQSPMLSGMAWWIVWSIPAVEILIAIFLIPDKTRLLALYASFSLMLMFTAYIYVILHYSDYVPCSCGGILEKLKWPEHMMFNIAFVLLSALAVLWSDRILPQKAK